MTASQFIKRAEKYNLPFSQIYDLIAFMLDIDYSEAKYASDKEIDDERAENVLYQLENKEPCAYITGRREFYGREFIVNHNTLIPRIETEILVEEVIKRYKNAKNIELIDICSGSGAIGLTLMYELSISFLTLLDIDEKSLAVSKQNAEKFNIIKNIELSLLSLQSAIYSRKRVWLLAGRSKKRTLSCFSCRRQWTCFL